MPAELSLGGADDKPQPVSDNAAAADDDTDNDDDDDDDDGCVPAKQRRIDTDAVNVVIWSVAYDLSK